VKLKENMIETEGEVKQIDFAPNHPFTEAPWIHKHNGKYYLTYASEWPEKIAYAVSDKITGPYECKGVISEIAGNSNTTHPAIVNFKGKWLFFSHNGGLHSGTSYSRSVIAEEMEHAEDGTIKKIHPTTKGVEFKEWSGNPILPGFHADPEVLYSEKTGRYYIYSTTDGNPGWGGWYFTCYSSDNLVDWRYEGINLDLCKQTKWAYGNAWAPCIIEKKIDGKYKYFFYYSGDDGKRKSIGVAIADHPTGPFVDFGKPIINKLPAGQKHGQQIDVDVFHDPDTGIDYLYWGNGYMAGARLNPDMTSIDESTTVLMTPKGGSLKDYAYREAPYVFKRNGIYYFHWSVDDTGSPNYHVAYGTSKSPLGPIEVAEQPVILIQQPDAEIYGPAHNSVLQIPGTDEWYFVYHRINKNFINRDKGPGWHREVCIDKMEFDEDGKIKPTIPTQKGVKAIK
jgi:beta-xylosidase